MLKGKRILDYFFVLRPMLFLPGWSTLLAGYFVFSRGTVFPTYNAILSIDYLRIILGMLAFASAMGAAFLLNQLEDIESDRENNKLFFFADEIITKKEALVETFLLIGLALFTSAYLGLYVFLWLVCFLIVTGYLYNYSPFSLKNRPLLSLASNALMGGLAFAVGWSLNNSQPGLVIIVDMLPYLFLNTALYFFTTLPDIEGDVKSRKETLAVKYGTKKIIIVALFCYALSVGFAVLNKDYFIGLILAVSAPQYIRLILIQQVKYAIKTTKYTILFFSIAICIKIPFYLIVISGIILLTKWYYRYRFNFDYPNIKGV